MSRALPGPATPAQARADATHATGAAGAPSTPTNEAVAQRIRLVVRAVVRQALRDARRERIGLLRADSSEGRLLREWLDGLPVVLLDDPHDAPDDVLPTDPLNKTALLLAPHRAVAPLLPLGDLYASRVGTLTGDWTAPDEVRILAERAGGVERLDGFLQRVAEGREGPNAAAAALPEAARAPILEAWDAGWWWLRRVGVVAKLEERTPGLDPF